MARVAAPESSTPVQVSLRAAGALFLERQHLDRPRARRLNARTLLAFASDTGGIQLDATVMAALGASGRFSSADPRFYQATGATSGHDADDRIIVDLPEVRRFRPIVFAVARRLLQPAKIDVGNVAAQPSIIGELCQRHRIIPFTKSEQPAEAEDRVVPSRISV